MALILAVDSGNLRSATLDEVRRALGDHDLVVVDSPSAALAAIERRIPDALLLPAELDAAETSEICTRLRALAGRDVPTVTLPAIDEAASRSDPRAIAAEIERALRAPVVAAARALVAWVRERRTALAEAPAAAAGVAAFPSLDEEPEPEPESEREPWLAPAIASVGRGVRSAVGAAASGVGSAVGAAAGGVGSATRAVASPLVKWVPRLAAAALVVGLAGYAGVRGRPYVMQWIEEVRSRVPTGEPAAEPAPSEAPVAPEAAAPPADTAARAGDTIPGWVAVFAPFELVAREGARVVRIDERNEIMLSPGTHEITFSNERFGFEDVRRVDIEPAKTTRVSILPPRSSITISANMPAEVWVDGEPVGQTPLLDLPADLGTREVVLRNADGVERRRMIIVTVAPVAVDVDFSQP